MATCKKGTKKVKGRCVPNKGCRFVRGGGGRVTCKGKSGGRKASSRRRSASCKAGMKKGKGGRCYLKKGYKFGRGGRVVRAKAA